MSLTYSTYTTTIANLMGDPLLVADANFTQILPSAIDDAEQRICREVDFLGAVVTDSSSVTTPGNRQINWGNSFFVVESINAISPAGTTNPDLGTRNPLLPANKELCDYLYPSSTGSGVPQYLGRVTQSTAVLAPWPDGAYTLEITGTQRPPSLSASNTTTFISTYLPDLLVAATMIYMSAYQENFSAMGDNPAQAVNWDKHYQDLLKSAVLEEARKKFQTEGWSSAQPSPAATPART
jgi:hypothetical protein